MTVARNRFFRALALLGLGLAGALVGPASTFLKLDIPALKQISRSVVQGRVVDIQSSWNEEHTLINTYVTLRVMRTLKGESETQIVIRVPGGTAEGMTITMAGAPEFEKGSMVVAFLTSWKDGTPKVTGYQQGVSKVVPDSLGNQFLRGGAADGLTVAGLARQLAAGGGQ